MIPTVVVGHGLAGRAFHCPLIRRQPDLKLHGIVARDPRGPCRGRGTLGRGRARLSPTSTTRWPTPRVELVVIATPHDTHADLAVRTLDAAKHCVVDKVMALTTADADRMIAARDRSGCMLSVFHNRRWDWDYLTVKNVLDAGTDRPAAALRELGLPPCPAASLARPSRTRPATILHDWGAHLVDQALQLGLGPCRRLTAWLTPAPWQGVDSGGHGRIVLEFDDVLFQIESSRICRIDRPRWWIVGTEGGFVKYGIDPQEEALRAGDIDRATERPEHRAQIRRAGSDRQPVEAHFPTVRGHWDSYYRNIAEYLSGRAPLAVTAEQARTVVRLLEAAELSARSHAVVNDP